ncbi:MAG: hypothetical protein ACE5Q6_18635 [Dehalococcoidia bacterium]
MWAKMCPKCGGDLYLREDPYINEVVCLQCGLVLTPAQEARLARELGRDKERAQSAA